VPVAQLVEPVWHGSPGGVHACPSWQATHVPVRQTSPVPHRVPSATAAPVEVHNGAPLEQSSRPVWQGLGGFEHGAP